MPTLDALADESFCYLTTRGRVTGSPHEIEIWFAAKGSSVYMLAGGGERADWVRNLLADPNVTVRIRDRVMRGRARVVEDSEEQAWARRALFDKYDPSYGDDLTGWSRTALPIAVDVDLGEPVSAG